MELFSGAGRATYLKRAERLGNYGWVPEDLRRVCSNPREVAQLPGSDYSVTSEDQAEALAALVHEASIYYSNGHSLALSLRLSYVARLSTSGWALSEVASLLGMTRQRVHAMLKEWRKGQPRKV